MRRAIMKQGWYDLVYVHFEYPADVVQQLLPSGLEVDTYNDKAWVGLIPFSMRGIGLPRLPAIPYFGSFPEVNVRTYVTRNGVPGVWFFSLDINRMAPTFIARTTYKLPYCFGAVSHMQEGDDVYTTVKRRWPRHSDEKTPRTALHIRIGDHIDTPTDFDVFVSARWGLYSHAGRQTLRYAPVDHPTWPLQRASIVSLDDSLITAAGLPAPTSDPHVMFSSGVPVLVGLPHKV